MQTQEARDLRRLLWPAALNGVCAAIIAAFVFVALGLLHPALALPPIGLGVLGALTPRTLPARRPAPTSLSRSLPLHAHRPPAGLPAAGAV
jgi:hypothetical protein